MNRSEISQAIKSFLEEENPSLRDPLEWSTDLLDNWFADSLAIFNMVMFLEDGFGIRFQRADINSRTFQTIGTLTDYVLSRREEVA